MRKRKKIAAIIQARIGSTRLPGKVLIPILGKPMLWYIINRLKHSKLIDTIVIATTTDKKDMAIVKFCRQNRIHCYRGDENDVLARYYQAAKKYRAGVIVRITADCPLIDPSVSDKIIKRFLKSKNTDYASNTLKRSYPRGLDTEVFSLTVLEKAFREAKELYQREHVTPYIYGHPQVFCLASIKNNKDFSFLRWTVDEKRDLEFVREIYKKLYRKRKIFLMKDIVNLLQEEPYLMKINKGVKQKKAKA
jgi:spore coat polysaccharide biosynthesis protein SpsF